MITPETEQRLHRLVDVFLEENEKVNLSAFRTPELCYEGNVRDSLPALDIEEFRQLKEGDSVLDIGTGGGFPLLPLAICMPQIRFVGLDSTQKKLDAIGRIAAALDLKNVELVCGRAEELGHTREHREQYAIVTARAVAPLNVLMEFAAPFARLNGHIVAWKSLHLQEELQESLHARSELHSHLTRTHRYALAKDFGERQLLVFTKTSPTPPKYPRDTGIPKKHPLV